MLAVLYTFALVTGTGRGSASRKLALMTRTCALHLALVSDMNQVAIADDVFLTLQGHLACRVGGIK